ncbi:MAG: hypothetical protein Ct9H300mP23_11610 [Nitrospinota bacterium]|nr:MAG: hypothetical protein Ct9H300mP23_11610 [Nitrospinota bacterium]
MVHFHCIVFLLFEANLGEENGKRIRKNGLHLIRGFC